MCANVSLSISFGQHESLYMLISIHFYTRIQLELSHAIRAHEGLVIVAGIFTTTKTSRIATFFTLFFFAARGTLTLALRLNCTEPHPTEVGVRDLLVKCWYWYTGGGEGR